MRAQYPVRYKTVRLNEQDIFYREAGAEGAPVILLLHGFPTSLKMSRNLIPRLAGSFRLVVPHYPGYGQGRMPDGGPISYRVALKQPEVVQALIVQNGNAHEEGLPEFGDWQGSR
jgi:hypothetical protein